MTTSGMLRQIPKLAEEVVAGWPKGVKSPRYDGVGGGHGGLSSSPALVDLDRMMFMFGADTGGIANLSTLTNWANHISREVAEVTGIEEEDFSVYGLPAVCDYIDRALDWSYHRGWDKDMCSDIRYVWLALRRYAGVIDRPGSAKALALVAKWKNSGAMLTATEASEKLSISGSTIRSWSKRGKITPRYSAWELIELAYGSIVDEIEESLHIGLTDDANSGSVANE